MLPPLPLHPSKSAENASQLGRLSWDDVHKIWYPISIHIISPQKPTYHIDCTPFFQEKSLMHNNHNKWKIWTFSHGSFFHIAIMKPSMSPSYKMLLVAGAAGSRQSHQTKYCAWWLEDGDWQCIFLIFHIMYTVHHMAWNMSTSWILWYILLLYFYV